MLMETLLPTDRHADSARAPILETISQRRDAENAEEGRGIRIENWSMTNDRFSMTRFQSPSLCVPLRSLRLCVKNLVPKFLQTFIVAFALSLFSVSAADLKSISGI